MFRVKICGLTRKEDIECVNQLLPDYIGIVFAKSSRRVTKNHAKKLIKNIDNRIKKVGIFVNENIDVLLETSICCDLEVLQLHGDETPQYIEELKNKISSVNGNKDIQIWKAFRIKDDSSLEQMRDYSVDAFVLDAYIEGEYGGAGKTFNWDLAVKAKEYGKIILAGGLNSENVNEGIRIVEPYVVDVSSGVETDGLKDKEKIKRFIEIVRSV